MSTVSKYHIDSINKANPIFSSLRTTIETTFYTNNVKKVVSLENAYELAYNSKGTIVTDVPVYAAEKLGLSADAKVLISNDGKITGRNAKARRIKGKDKLPDGTLDGIIRDAIYGKRKSNFYKTTAVVGLDKDFMVKAHLVIPEGDEYLLYSWLLNFQFPNETIENEYNDSKKLPEGDILVYADPTWKDPDFPDGLVCFDNMHNAVAILGMRYFGELKKSTLTLAWSIAHRNGYIPCHGGIKRYSQKEKGVDFVASFFGLSGTGKSTLTHAKHEGKYEISVLHDDAFIINTDDYYSIALEPSYFDKTNDYKANSEDNKFIITAQNIGAAMDDGGKIVPVTEDIRNANGRAIKSSFWSDNRVNRINEPINSIFWLMKDSTMPPVLKINDPTLAAVMGLTLTTKKTAAEVVKSEKEFEKDVIVPYANPFRIYSVQEDYLKFKELFTSGKVNCYILNTGDFLGKKIYPKTTLDIIESIVENKKGFTAFGPTSSFETLELMEFMPDFSDKSYKKALKEKLENRRSFIHSSLKEEFDVKYLAEISGVLESLILEIK